MDTLSACRIAGYFKRVPVIFDSHEFFSEVPELHHRPLKKWLWIQLEKWFIPGADHHFTVSPGLVKLYKNRYKCDFELLRNLPLKNEKNPLPDVNTNSRLIIYQGALNLGRGIAPTIRAMQYLPGYRFIIVGRGDEMKELKALAHSLQLDEQVIFKGAVPFEELEKYNSGAMVGICLLENMGLNYYHSLPNRIFDYMQLGIPVIASDFPDIQSIVKTYDTGLLVNDLSPQTIARAIKEACENQNLRLKWRETIPMAADIFTWEKEEKKIRQKLEGL
jgi:glycosyltransferase involved in cell wall biosynthesis